MRKRAFALRHTPLLAAAVLIVLSANPCFASISYSVSIDTSSFSGQAGFLDFEFNPGGLTSQLAMAQVSNFSPSVNLGAVQPPVLGDITGTLPPSITIVNDVSLNDYFIAFTYASLIDFTVTLSGDALDAPNGTAISGTTFGFGMYDSNPSPILTSNPDGFAFTIDINLDGTTTVTDFITSTHSIDQVVPEPASMALGLTGLSAMIALCVRRRNSKLP